MFGTQFANCLTNFLSEASSSLCNCQAYVAARLSRHRRRSAFSHSSSTLTDHVSMKQLSGEKAVCLADLGLQHLPQDWIERLREADAVADGGRRSSVAYTSYVSTESFFENKHGFPKHLLSPNTRQNLPSIFSDQFNMYRLQSIRSLSTHPFGLRQQHRSMTQVTQRYLMDLERLANMHSNEAAIQAAYLQAVVHEDPQYVIRRFESGKYASNEECTSVYQQAKRLNANVRLSTIGSRSRNYEERQSAGEQLTDIGRLGSENKPLHVVQQSSKSSFFWNQLFNTLKYVVGLIILVSVFDAAFQMRGMTTNHKSVLPDRSDRKYRFEDVQGVDEAKEELQEVVEFLRSPDKFKRLGGKLPKGVLLIGPPGTGKTLLARAVAGEAGVPFFFCSGSEFDEMFVGVGAARVRNLFSAAKEHAPCIVFVDELDAIGGRRIKNDVQPYSRMTLNQLLVEMDGFEQNSGVVVIGATNFPEVLDEALVRPGRFDSKIVIAMPDVKARHDILKVHVKDIPLSKDVDLQIIARGTSGMTGADLAGVINQAAIRSSAIGKDDITMIELEWAKDKIMMGPERKSAVIDDACKRTVAFHEAGHALVAVHTDGALPVHKATIMPRGPALGLVAQLPEKDELLLSKKQLLAKMDVAMAGRVAEELIFGNDNVTTGASSDFEQATAIASSMVARFGMSDKVGPVLHRLDVHSDVSPETRHLIEVEVKRLLQESYDRASHVLRKHASEHRLLAEALLKYETLTLDEIKTIISGKNLDRKL